MRVHHACAVSFVAAVLAPRPATAAGLPREEKAWLDAVAILLLPGEQAAFESLKGKEDRAEFKRIFWARRDPDLDTPENEFQRVFEERRRVADERYHTGMVRRVPRSSDLRDADRSLSQAEQMEALEVRQLRDLAEREETLGSQTDCGRVFIMLGEPDEVRELDEVAGKPYTQESVFQVETP